MLTRIRKTLAPPVLAGDEDRMCTAGVLNTILLTMPLSVSLVGGAVPPVFVQKPHSALFVLQAAYHFPIPAGGGSTS